MIRVPIDPLCLRRKLDVQWMKGVWAGRLDESDEHVVTGRTVRRLAGHLRIQPGQVGKLKSRVRDPALSQAEHPKVLLASVPIRLAGETDTEALAEEQDSAAQREQTEETVNERAKAEITRSSQAPEDDTDKEVKRQRLGEPLATIPEQVSGDHHDGRNRSAGSRRSKKRRKSRQENCERFRGAEQWQQRPEEAENWMSPSQQCQRDAGSANKE